MDFGFLRPFRRPTASERGVRLRRIFDESYESAWRVLRRAGVPPERLEDTVQQVFLVVAERLHDIRPGSERAFVYGVALGLARTQNRRRWREVLGDDSDMRVSTYPEPEAALDQKELAEACDRLIASLDPDAREVFILHEVEGLSGTEIGTILRIPVGTVSSRLRRARLKFREGIEALAGNRALRVSHA